MTPPARDGQLQSQLSSIQDADITASILELQDAQFQRQAAFSARAKVPPTSLFDYIRCSALIRRISSSDAPLRHGSSAHCNFSIYNPIISFWPFPCCDFHSLTKNSQEASHG